MMNLRSLFSLLATSILMIQCQNQGRQTATEEPGNFDVTHSFFIAGPQFTGIIGENGEEIWNSQKIGARDGYVLENGNILICWADEVREYNTQKEVIFTFQRESPENELGTAVHLENGNTLITESGKSPRMMEVDSAGRIVLSIPLQPETDNVHMQTRMARKLANGNYLVPHLLAFSVKEYDPAGIVVNTFRTDKSELGGREGENWPFTAIRLPDGNTVVALTHGNKVVELDEDGNVVWQVSNEDFKENIIQDACGAQRLPNGNTVIASYKTEDGIKLFEVTRDKRMVWNYDGYRIHEFQILTTNGMPTEGIPMK